MMLEHLFCINSHPSQHSCIESKVTRNLLQDTLQNSNGPSLNPSDDNFMTPQPLELFAADSNDNEAVVATAKAPHTSCRPLTSAWKKKSTGPSSALLCQLRICAAYMAMSFTFAQHEQTSQKEKET